MENKKPFYERYSKKIIEEYSLKTISNSFDNKYSCYYSPQDTNNFDYISPDRKAALEITSVFPKNVLEAYVYEKEFSFGKENLSKKRITKAKFFEDGSLQSFYGGGIQEIITGIYDAVNKKQCKAQKRLEKDFFQDVDLCVCIQDGGLLDLKSFQIAFTDFDDYIFKNIFFITRSNFIRYSKNSGFYEYIKK